VLLGKRSANVQQGGTWSTIGGAIDHGETPLDAAMRELGEEICGLDSSRGTVTFELIAPCLAGCGWSYSTYVVRVPLAARAGRHGRLPRVRVATDAYNQWETDKAAWFGVHRVAGLRLHPGLAAAWPALRPAVRRDRA
jgi:8-oxo-dGTP pyrophosphatase MutT (NUDIX family)